MKKKIKVCLLFGGKSGEHEISLLSAKSIYNALDKTKYKVILVAIDKQGKWLLLNASNYLLNSSNSKLIKINKANSKNITFVSKGKKAELLSLESRITITSVDVFFPIIHGTFGEDGCIQGLLELLNTAYVGANVLGSSVGMDKDIMKKLLRDAKIPIAKFNTFKRGEKVNIKGLQYPVFVKPANMGSSVGIVKVKNKKELNFAIKKAFLYDTKILIEEYIKAREIECSVLGNENPIASVPGEIIPKHEFYSYIAKYIDKNGAELKIPAKLSSKKIKEIQSLAIKAYKALECSGMARVDFFLTLKGKIILNEINTLPGFTKISMYPKLWEISGIPYTKLLDRLIELAIEKKKQKDSLKREFSV